MDQKRHIPCPRAEELQCHKLFVSKRNAMKHAQAVHDEIKHRCPQADEFQCDKIFAYKADAISHARKKHNPEKHPCPLAKEVGCTVVFNSKQNAKQHVRNVHSDKATRPQVPCPRASELSCDKTFSSQGNAKNHAREVHDQFQYCCPQATKEGCNEVFSTKHGAKQHALRKHGPQVPQFGIPCPRADEFKCTRTFSSKRNAERHARQLHLGIEHPCPLAESTGCTVRFSDEQNAKRHAKKEHGDNPTAKNIPCPRAKEENCSVMFTNKHNATVHATNVHGKAEPNVSFIPAWPRIAPHIPLKDVDGNVLPGWDKLPNLVVQNGVWTCPDPSCNRTTSGSWRMRDHYAAAHLNARWPCPCVETLGCGRNFFSKYDAKTHSEEHYPNRRWICQHEQCLGHIQGREQSRSAALVHYKTHVRRGHFEKGECEPFMIPNPSTDEKIEMDEAFVYLEEVREEDSGSENEDEEDHECEVEDDEEERFEIFEPTTAMAADWLENQPEAQEAQDILRDIARQEGLLHLGLKCPGPGLVSEGLVQGAQRCAKNAVISFETGVFYRHNFNQHIGIRSRCKFCHGGFMFNQYLRQYILEAGSGQTTCSSQNCFDPIWQSSKFCKKHFLAWSPDRPGEDINAVNELRSLFQKAASEQWSPKTAEMAGLLRRAEAHAKTNVPASDIVNLDIEFTFSSQEVLQIGLADLKGAKALDCLTEHSEGIVAPSSSRHPVPLTFRQKRHRDKVRSHFVQDGTLNANSVVKKLQEAGISTDTTFLAWATWCFDLKYLRNWLQQEGFHNVLPEEKELCLVLNEFRDNLNAIIGYKCYRGGVFPLRLSLVFPLLFGKDHPLAGRNHHALVDAQQLSLMTRLFIDLCKPPDEREFWQGSGVTKLGSWKVQQKLEAFYSPSTDKELESARGEQELEELSSPPEMEKQGPGKEPEQAEPFSPTESRKLESKKRQRRRKGTSAPRRPTKRPRAR